MKLSFSLRHSLVGLLTGTSIAAIAIGHLVATNSWGDRENAQIKIATAVQVDSLSDRDSDADTHISYVAKRNVLANREEEPPIPNSSGGSR